MNLKHELESLQRFRFVMSPVVETFRASSSLRLIRHQKVLDLHLHAVNLNTSSTSKKNKTLPKFCFCGSSSFAISKETVCLETILVEHPKYVGQKSH